MKMNLVILIAIVMFSGCQIRNNENAKLNAYDNKGNTIDEKVTNGIAYFKAVVPRDGVTKIRLCGNIGFINKKNGDFEIFGKATLMFAGHPGKKMTFIGLQNTAMRIDKVGNEMIITDTVTWDSNIEGGAYLNSVVFVPYGIDVVAETNAKANLADGKYLDVQLDDYRTIERIISP